MKYKLLKSLPWIKKGLIFEYHKDDTEWVKLIEWSTITWLLDFIQAFGLNNKFFESLPVEEESKKEEPKKKTYDDLILWKDRVYYINAFGEVFESAFSWNEKKSTTFLTRQEAEDEHARREFSARKDRFIPKEGEGYWYWAHNQWCLLYTPNTRYSAYFLNINLGLAFRSKEEAEELLTDEVKRLFFTIR